MNSTTKQGAYGSSKASSHASSHAASSLRWLVLPGWLDSGPTHWQSQWQSRHGFERVQQTDWVWPRRGDWMACLEEALLSDPRPAVLAAHSLGCHLIASWASHSQHLQLVCAALLVAPPELERDDLPPQLCGWRPTHRMPLPFAATLVYSDDDPFSDADASRQLAQDWAVPAWHCPARGHLNGDSGLGDWPEGLEHLRQLAKAAGD